MRISDWSSDVCSSDLPAELLSSGYGLPQRAEREALAAQAAQRAQRLREQGPRLHRDARSLLPRRQRDALDAIEAHISLLGTRPRHMHRERAPKRVTKGKSESVRIDLVGRRSSNKKKTQHKNR